MAYSGIVINQGCSPNTTFPSGEGWDGASQVAKQLKTAPKEKATASETMAFTFYFLPFGWTVFVRSAWAFCSSAIRACHLFGAAGFSRASLIWRWIFSSLIMKF